MINDTIEIINLVPKFLDFYNKAVGCDEETRFELWKKHYGFAMSWERPVASLVVQEGLATQLSKYLVPGQKDEIYVAAQEGWLQECCKDAKQILQGMKPYLQECSAERIVQFTMGAGTTGKAREGYFAGWKLIGDMLEGGWSFAEIARIREEDMADALVKYIG